MDELDILAEMPVATTRRSVTTKLFEFEVDEQPSEDLRKSLLEALTEDLELQALGDENHPRAVEFAIDAPEPHGSGSIYRIRIDFEPGEVDYERVRGIIADNLAAERLALR
jgi:hypothetical protein